MIDSSEQPSAGGCLTCFVFVFFGLTWLVIGFLLGWWLL